MAVQTIQEPSFEEEKRKRQRTKADPKGREEHSSAKNKHKIMNKKAGQRAMTASRRAVFALPSHTRVQARISTKAKARERTKKEKARRPSSSIRTLSH